jgi:hypothetical protein
MEKALLARHQVDWKGALAATFQAPPALAAAFIPHLWPVLVPCAAGALVVTLWQTRRKPADLGNQDPVPFYLHQIADMEETAVAKAVADSGKALRYPSNWFV